MHASPIFARHHCVHDAVPSDNCHRTRCIEISQPEGSVDRHHHTGPGGPGGKIRSDQALGARAGGPADRGVSEELGNYPTATCHPGGMPRMMSIGEYEYIVEPETTYILIGGEDHYRRIFTDGRPWPAEIVPSYAGYSIGKWIDEGGSGRFNVLEVETRGPFKGPRAYDATGLPLHFDNQSVFHERFYLDKADPNILHDMITVIDHALTRPWTSDKRYRRNPDLRAQWPETYCNEGNAN